MLVLVVDDVLVDEVVDQLVWVVVEGWSGVGVFPQSLFAARARWSFDWDATWSPWFVAALQEMGTLGAALAGYATAYPTRRADTAVRFRRVRYMREPAFKSWDKRSGSQSVPEACERITRTV